MTPPPGMRLVDARLSEPWMCPTCIPSVRFSLDSGGDATAVTQLIRHTPGCAAAARWLVALHDRTPQTLPNEGEVA